jgi:prephenate dehydrogenase
MNNPESVGSNRLSALIHSLGARVTFLFNNNINIKNMELLKIREGIGGTFRLSFDNKPDCKKAKQIIEQIGFSIKL